MVPRPVATALDSDLGCRLCSLWGWWPSPRGLSVPAGKVVPGCPAVGMVRGPQSHPRGDKRAKGVTCTEASRILCSKQVAPTASTDSHTWGISAPGAVLSPRGAEHPAGQQHVSPSGGEIWRTARERAFLSMSWYPLLSDVRVIIPTVGVETYSSRHLLPGGCRRWQPPGLSGSSSRESHLGDSQ